MGPGCAHPDRVGLKPRRGRRKRTRRLVQTLEVRALYPTSRRAPFPATPYLKPWRALGSPRMHPKG
eukprot:4901839-Amphidinium_carterae.1